MSGKDSYTPDEWKLLQWAVMLAGSHVTACDYPGLWNSFKEAAGGSRYLMAMQQSEGLVGALAKDQARKKPPGIDNRDDMASDKSLAVIRDATAIVGEKDPDQLDAFQWLCVGTAQAVASEVDGTSDTESEAIKRVKAAVGLTV